MKPRFYLDPSGGAEVAGAHSVSSEAEFLRLALEERPLLVQGDALCHWARRFGAGRGLPTQDVVAPTTRLQGLLPHLPLPDAQAALERWPDLTQAGSAEELAQVVLGTATPVGEPRHAAQWLLWWAGDEAGHPTAQTLMRQLGTVLAADLGGRWRQVYADTAEGGPAAAEALLRGWLRLDGEGPDWPRPFPVPLTGTVSEQFRAALVQATAEGGLAVYRDLRERQADPQVLGLAGTVAGEWLRYHPGALNRDVLREVQDHLPKGLHDALLAGLPRPLPPMPPLDVPAWAEWMTADYLPYRSWDGADHAALRPHLRQFVERFLPVYAAALNGGAHAERLIWQRSAALKSQPYVTLVAVCDGLHLHDLATLQRELAGHDSGRRLTLTEQDVAFGALPTITSRAKPALFCGVSPAQAGTQDSLGPHATKEEKVAAALREAVPGTVVFWNIAEPDVIYHKAESLDRARDEVAARLSVIAKRLLGLMTALPEGLPVQLVVTTDHGRLLRTSARTATPPAGFAPEGRAAYGTWADIPAEGFRLEENLALLGRSRFGLAEDAAALFSDETFVDSAGRGGNVICPHGGLSPEEVLLPWAVYVRDLAFRLPTLSAEGAGQAEEVGTFTLTLTNPNSVPLTVERLSGSLGAQLTDQTAWTVPPQSQGRVTLSLASWPTSAALGALTLRARVRAPQGVAQDVAVTLNLKSEELYTSTGNILGDLL
ncbi:hypothetical protein SAMN04488058_13213 [Deinococcus reticulitermitis]|uniref:PglZ domain-containing protein n=1 Tax=Deinococcus reticulitermitis TaxID=856736 RepID=A0A1H7CWX5_9DEIO|nr:LEA type 2 family protein [Deinococcus reticulitermitis]SEJ90345.1 hypothetical protein SAMN04488058_13213 [Deinococcus reticulitermitis]